MCMQLNLTKITKEKYLKLPIYSCSNVSQFDDKINQGNLELTRYNLKLSGKRLFMRKLCVAPIIRILTSALL